MLLCGEWYSYEIRKEDAIYYAVYVELIWRDITKIVYNIQPQVQIMDFLLAGIWILMAEIVSGGLEDFTKVWCLYLPTSCLYFRNEWI